MSSPLTISSHLLIPTGSKVYLNGAATGNAYLENQAGYVSAPNFYVTNSFVSSVALGAPSATFSAAINTNAITFSVDGARLRLGAPTNAYFYCDGYSIVTPGPLATTQLSLNGLVSIYDGGSSTTFYQSYKPDGVSAVAHKFGTAYNLAQPTARIITFENNGVEKASIDGTGNFYCAAFTGTSFNITSSLSVYVQTSNLLYESYIANSASAIGHRLGTAVSFSTAGAKIATFENAGVVVAYIDKDGGADFSGVSFSCSGNNFLLNGSGMRVPSSTIYGLVSSPVIIRPGTSQTDSGTSVQVVSDGHVTLTVAGSKLHSFRNNTVEKSFMDIEGQYENTGNGNGIILKSPDGTRYRLTIANGGTTAVAAA